MDYGSSLQLAGLAVLFIATCYSNKDLKYNS